MSADDVREAMRSPGMPIWLGRIGEVPPGTERIANLPWELMEEHAKQAEKNHGQSLKRLKERGGLSVSETACILRNESYRNLPIFVSIQYIADRVEAFNKAQALKGSPA